MTLDEDAGDKKSLKTTHRLSNKIVIQCRKCR